MTRRAALALALLAAAPGCRHRGRRHHPAATSAGRWTALVPGADALRVIDGHYLAGVVRRTDAEVAGAPYPVRPLVSAARVDDGWRFASADGTLYAAADFLGPLRVIAAVPDAARPPGEALAQGVVRGVFQQGGLAYVGHTGRAWALDGATPRPLPLEHALAVVFTSARRVLALTEPGRLHRSDDGGRHFTELALPGDDVPTALGVVHGAALIESVHGRWVLDDAGVPTARTDALTLATFVRATELPSPRAAVAPLLLPADPSRVAALADGTLAVIDGDSVVTLDPRTRRELRRVTNPGDGCVIAGAHGSWRLVCTHEGWARAVFAPTEAGGWRVLRDARLGDPMGDVVFDDRSEAFVVAAPCERGATPDATAFCVHGADGRGVTVRAPFAAQPLDMHGGAALLVETHDGGGAGRAVVLRGTSMSSLTLPVGAGDARALRWAGDALAVWGRRADGRPVLHRGVFDGSRSLRWSAHDAPIGSLRGVHGAGGVAYAVGRGADALWRYEPGVGFARMPSPVRGSAASVPLDAEGLSYCAGSVCRLAGVLEWTDGVSGSPWFVTRARGVPPRVAGWSTPPLRAPDRTHFACAWGDALGPAPLLERGAAVSGYTLQWTDHRGEVTVRWSGEGMSQETRARLPPTDERVTLRGAAAVGVTQPVALIDRCAGARCETFLATATGVQPFPLEHFAGPFATELLRADGGRVTALSRGSAGGSTVVQAVAFDAATGQVAARRTVVTEAPPELVHAGSLDGRDGLWVPAGARRWRYVALAGDAGEMTAEDDGALSPCAGTAAGRGVMRRTHRWSEVRGADWAPNEVDWQVEELLEVTDRGLCVRAIAGGESRDLTAVERHGDEGSPVRSFALRAEAGALRGEAWRGRRRVGLSCERVAARRTIGR